jgi:DNA polymerase III subunit beta
MQIQIGKVELAEVLKRVLPCVEKKTTIPILSNVLVSAEGDQIRVTATDLDNALTITFSGKVKEEGSITIPARRLADTLAKLKSLPEAEVDLKSNKENWVTLTCGPLSVKLPGIDSKSYPKLEEWPLDKPIVEMKGRVMAGLIHRTSYAIAQEESRYTLNGALFVATGESVRMVATDGHRCAIATHTHAYAQEGKGKGEMRTLIKKEAIRILAHLAEREGEETITLARSDSYIFVRGGEGGEGGAGWTFQTRILQGQFPNWEAIIPKENGKRITAKAGELAASLGQIIAFSDERSRGTRWELIPGKGIKLSASSIETGEASTLLSLPYDGESVLVSFDGDYVTDILKTLGKDDSVTLAIRDADSAALWIPVEKDGWETKCVLMPMRI